MGHKYRDIYGTYEIRESNHKLKINCDNTAESWLWGDKNVPISGYYTVNNDTLTLKVNLSEFDTLFSTKWNGVIKFRIKKNQLIRTVDVYEQEFENKINKSLRKHPLMRTKKKSVDPSSYTILNQSNCNLA